MCINELCHPLGTWCVYERVCVCHTQAIWYVYKRVASQKWYGVCVWTSHVIHMAWAMCINETCFRKWAFENVRGSVIGSTCYAAMYMTWLVYTATHCDALQHTATQCDALQHTTTHMLRIHIYDMTHSYTHHVHSFLVCTCNVTHSYTCHDVWHDSSIYVTRTRLCAWHESFIHM